MLAISSQFLYQNSVSEKLLLIWSWRDSIKWNKSNWCSAKKGKLVFKTEYLLYQTSFLICKYLIFNIQHSSKQLQQVPPQTLHIHCSTLYFLFHFIMFDFYTRFIQILTINFTLLSESPTIRHGRVIWANAKPMQTSKNWYRSKFSAKAFLVLQGLWILHLLVTMTTIFTKSFFPQLF